MSNQADAFKGITIALEKNVRLENRFFQVNVTSGMNHAHLRSSIQIETQNFLCAPCVFQCHFHSLSLSLFLFFTLY